MKTYTAGPCETCGYTAGPSRTPGLALRSLAAHSCEKQTARAAAIARGEARRAAVDHTPKPCLHKQADHQHGTHACYVLDRCRCHPCAKANREYERDRAKRHAYGRFDTYVDAQPVREHVERLMAAGIGLKRITTLSTVSHGGLTKLIYGGPGKPPSVKVTRDVADRILAVRITLDAYAPGARVPNVGTKRRLQALMRAGWSQSQIAARIGMEVRNFNHLLHGKRAVTAKNARAVLDLFEELWDQAPPAATRWQRASVTRSRGYALAHGFAPAMAWDEDAWDDPEAVPDVGETARSNVGRPLEHLIEDVAWILAEVDPLATAEQIAHRLGYTDRSAIQNAIHRAGRDHDLGARLARNAEIAGATVTRRRTA